MNGDRVPELVPRLCFTVSEAAEAIGVSPRQVYNLARDYGLPTILLGGRRLIRAADLRAWLDRQPLATGAESATATAEAEGVRRGE